MQTIIKSSVSYPFTPAPDEIVLGNLNPVAKAVHFYMLRRQQIPGWKMRKTDICKQLGLSMYAVKKALKILLEHGYASYERLKFRFTKWCFYPTPISEEKPYSHRIIERVENQTALQVEIQPGLNREKSLERKKQQQPVVVSSEKIEQGPIDSPELIFPVQLNPVQKKATRAVIKKVKQPELQQSVLFALGYYMAQGAVKSPVAYLRGLITAANNGTFEPIQATTAINQGGKPLIPIWQGFSQSTPSKPEVARSSFAGMKAALRGATI